MLPAFIIEQFILLEENKYQDDDKYNKLDNYLEIEDRTLRAPGLMARTAVNGPKEKCVCPLK